MKYLCIWLIRIYQKLLSPLKRKPTCRFSPTCSSYAIEAFQKRGFFIGLLLTVARIARCQPFGSAGWDPVPETGLRNPKFTARPMTKYYYPEEYGLERDRDADLFQQQ
ncbi:MAG: membrane protein insertion efficiency factor YidD [Clostridia bacterium]|nr:membrane protein insertion efficiency factor YidD [Clostridia bacterium]